MLPIFRFLKCVVCQLHCNCAFAHVAVDVSAIKWFIMDWKYYEESYFTLWWLKIFLNHRTARNIGLGKISYSYHKWTHCSLWRFSDTLQLAKLHNSWFYQVCFRYLLTFSELLDASNGTIFSEFTTLGIDLCHGVYVKYFLELWRLDRSPAPRYDDVRKILTVHSLLSLPLISPEPSR